MVTCSACGQALPPRLPSLTGRLQQIVEAVDGHWRMRGYAPTIREVADIIGVESTSTVQFHVDRLVARGVLLRTPRAQRSLRLPTGDPR